MKKIILIFTAFLFAANINAQKDSTIKYSPIQVSFIYPLGIHGTATNYINNISFNAISGINGGVHGLEFGGIYNHANYEVNGLQFAGILNTNFGKTEGFQFGGIMNTSKNVDGGQFAGCVNIAEDVDGVQFSGLFGLARNYDGPQFSGFMAMADTIDGPQIGGFMNLANRIDGIQLGGFANFANEVDGIQIAGFMNAAEKVEGVQLAGFINICDSIDGIPIAPISIVKNGGYRALDISVAETWMTNFSFLLGVRHFYSIYRISFQPTRDSRYGLGVGFGSGIQLQENAYIDLQGIVTQINEGFDEGPFQYTNLLNEFRFTYKQCVSDKLAFYIGPTFNVMVSKHEDENEEVIGSGLPPWTIYDKTRERNNDDTNVKMWPGLTVGMTFH